MKMREKQKKRLFVLPAAAAFLAFALQPAAAYAQTDALPPPSLTYADALDLADSAALVVKARIRRQSTLGPEHSRGLRPGWVRLYIEAQTEALLSGRAAIGESVRYLADVPLDARGRAPRLTKQSMLIFALPVPGRPSDLQLIDVDSQIPADPATESLVRQVLAELVAPDAPPRVTGIREALSVQGNLSGESETQLFLDTANGAPVSISILRRPNMAPQWGVSWTELVDQSARPLQPNTLEWYRLACSLPDTLPAGSILTQDGASRVLATQDYNYVRQQLGACLRWRGGPPRRVGS